MSTEAISKCITFIQEEGKSILFINLKDIREVELVYAISDHALELICAQPEHSVLLMTDITNCHYTRESIKKMKEFSNTITPHVKMSTIIGVKPINKIFFNALIRLTGRNIKMCNSVAEAQALLASIE